MTTPLLLIKNARVLTLAGPAQYRRGPAASDLGVLDDADILINEGRIAEVAPSIDTPAAETIDAQGHVLMPAFIDAHTHACWAGSRLSEWEAALKGESYLDRLGRGGGIMSTVRAVREATEQELTANLLRNLTAMTACGTLTAEVKSGYGLTTEDEIKMLRAIRAAGEQWHGTTVPTACIGHAIDHDQPNHTATTINETLPDVTAAFPHAAIDGYCEIGAWSLDQTRDLLTAAKDAGHATRIHTDQFNALGMVQEAIKLGVASVDHLEASGLAEYEALGNSDTAAVILPASGFHLDQRYSDGRALIDAGAALVLATNCNPGSAPCHSIPMAIALACRFCGLTPAEAITASTVNAAALLGLTDRGRIEPGLRADLIVLNTRDEREIAWSFGQSPVRTVIAEGSPLTP